jgi:ATP-dependent 26S proteasome regulatory subunit
MKISPMFLEDLSSCPESELALLRTRLIHAANDFSERTGIDDLLLTARRRSGRGENGPTGQSIAKQRDDFESFFQPRQPNVTFDRVCLPESTRELLLTAAATIQNERKLFEEWGLREIQSHARAALLLSGPPGTGKTIAAHGLASYLGQAILTATTADLESKYLGDGPKLVAAFFEAAREQNAVAFIDEADALLARRMVVTQGSERAANSMTSQLLIELEQHRGMVVFATNLLDNIDPAFKTRVLTIQVPLPDRAMRYEIWKRHLPEKLPLKDVDLDALADIEGICGRDVRNAVLLAANRAVSSACKHLTHHDIVTSIGQVINDNSH